MAINERTIRWGYKTVHFELKKEGLLGGTFLDETEIEQELNEFGSSGWELVSMLEVQDGVIAIFKQPLGQKAVFDEDRHVVAATGRAEFRPAEPPREDSRSQRPPDEERQPEEEAEPVSSIIGAIRIE